MKAPEIPTYLPFPEKFSRGEGGQILARLPFCFDVDQLLILYVRGEFEARYRVTGCAGYNHALKFEPRTIEEAWSVKRPAHYRGTFA